MRKSTIPRLLFVVAINLALSCTPAGRSSNETRQLQTVAVVTAERATVTRTVQLLGLAQGDLQAIVLPRIVGRVTEIARPEGSKVQAGDPILYVVNDVPGMDYKPGPVTSPISGVVGKLYVEVGQTVAPTMPVASVSNFSERVKVKAAISDQDLRFAEVGARAEVTVTAFPDKVFAGTVTQVSPVLDPMTRSATVEIVVPNRAQELVPGMACGVRLVLEEKRDVPAVPLAALFTDGLSRVAVLEGTKARLRPVVVGLVGDDLVEVVSGVAAGDKVVTTGKERLVDGSEVKPVAADQK